MLQCLTHDAMYYLFTFFSKVSVRERKNSALQHYKTKWKASNELVCKQSQAGMAANEARASND